VRHVRLGRTGLPVSRLCLGTMTFGLHIPYNPIADLLVAVDKPIAADLEARLDELTREYRWGDDPR
jgi:aryl-alcohol dehydrogenase-like predicted oxidoreductase